MSLVVKIILFTALGIVVVGALGVWWLIRWFRKAAAAELDKPRVPCRIHPEQEPNPQWRSAAKIGRFAGEFRTLGFGEVGAYSIPEMGGLQMLGFCHPGENFFGVIYDHKQLEPTFDIICNLGGETGVTGTNTKLGETLDPRPGTVTLRLDGASVREVFDAVRNHPNAATRQPVVPGEFLAGFNQSYARSMNWRIKQGGSTREEIRRQAKVDGIELDDEQIEEAYQNLRADHLEQLREACLAQYLDEQRTPAADWERIQDRVFAIPETMELKEVIEVLEGALLPDEEQMHQLAKLEKNFGQTALDVMDRILNENIGSLKVKKLGEVTDPARAYILMAPEWGADDTADKPEA